MPWIKDGVEYSENQIRSNHPNTSFPAPMEARHVADFGYAWREPVLVEPTPEPPRRTIRDWEFRDRFTQAEITQAIGLAYAGDQMAQYMVLKLQTSSDGVNLDSADTKNGVAYMASKIPSIDPATVLA